MTKRKLWWANVHQKSGRYQTLHHEDGYYVPWLFPSEKRVKEWCWDGFKTVRVCIEANSYDLDKKTPEE